ncbi:hypothetical protein P6166_04235 [Stenotrophomonas sp. HITSZ_GD]|uniref:hypothetical protein n=1 Tax=Stenotrophomonas sp. HITSZ_GD TaxID=3037248 RepID=UPI00240D6CEE|nr:hypothetical protein [Stenotrophomonas sp. HITSZ_GD]MDG2524566.1 hypothetical protein [Stenotrophomonas sp. HITSZ_GD]
MNEDLLRAWTKYAMAAPNPKTLKRLLLLSLEKHALLMTQLALGPLNAQGGLTKTLQRRDRDQE